MSRKGLVTVLAGAGMGAALCGNVAAQSRVTLYGLLDSGVSYSSRVAPSGGSRFSVDSGDLQQSRWGMRGTEDLGGGLKALFILEGGFSVANGTAGQGGLPLGRTTVVGLEGPFGTVELGRRKDFIDEIATWYSSVANFGVFINGVHDNNLDRVGGARSNNSVRYDSPEFRGFKANLTYGFGNTAGSLSTGQSLGFGANYANGPFGIGFGYWESKLGTGTQAANSSSDQGTASGAGCNPTLGSAGQTCVKTWMLGSSYTVDKFRVYASWSRTLQPLATYGGNSAPFSSAFTRIAGAGAFTAAGSNNGATNVFDVGANYFVAPDLVLIASVLQSRYSFVGTSTQGRLTQYNVGVDYVLSKRTDVYSYFANLRASNMYNPGVIGGAPGADMMQSAMTIGLRHKF